MASPETPSQRARPRRSHLQLSYENRVFLLALGAGAVPAIVAFILLRYAGLPVPLQWAITAIILAAWFGFATAVRTTVVRPLRTLANLQAAVREGDFSIRARPTGVNDSLSDLIYEINELTATLQEQRLGAFEASALMRKVLSEIDVAFFAFDASNRLRLINAAGERLMGKISERALGCTADQLGIADLLESEEPTTIERTFPGGSGRWGIRRTSFRQGGVPHQLIVIADLSRALREEERQAWQRLIRVLGHELNNSLAPMKSISRSLMSLLARSPRPSDWEEDVGRGLQIIAERAESLERFVADYSRLTRLPKPTFQEIDLASLINRVVALDKRVPVSATPGPAVRVEADPDQLQQLLINLVCNAIDASIGNGTEVELTWTADARCVRICILDQGPGIANSSNLFTPLFTTKAGGSGIGLALSRQIAEGHGGRVWLENRHDRAGAKAILELPLHNYS